MASNMVEVAYSSPNNDTFFVALQAPVGTTASGVLLLSGLFQSFPELEHKTLELGVFSTRVQPDYVVQSGDRIEVYRPLRISPMEARKNRVQR